MQIENIEKKNRGSQYLLQLSLIHYVIVWVRCSDAFRLPPPPHLPAPPLLCVRVNALSLAVT